MKTSQVAVFKQFLAAGACSMGVLISGTVIGWPSPALLKIKKTGEPFKITDSEINWMVSILFVGNILCPIPAGYVMDLIGRRNTLLLFSFFPLCGWIMVYTASQPYHLYIARILFGFWSGIMATIIPIYIAEISEARIRGALATLSQLSLNIGIVFSFIVGAEVSYHTFAIILGGLPFLFLICFGLMPESPYWLLMKEKRERAAKSLLWLRGRKNELIDREIQYMERSLTEEMQRKRSFKELFTDKSYKQAITTVFIIAMCQRMSGIGVIIGYASSAIPDGIGVLTTDEGVIVFGVIWCIAVPFATFLIDNMGRRPLLIISSIGCGITTFTIGLNYFLRSETSVDMSNAVWVDFASFLIFGFAFFSGLGPVTGAVQGEMFPSNVKAVASAMTVEVLSISSVISFKIFHFAGESVGYFLPFWIFCLFCFLFPFFVIFYVVETKGKTLHEIQVIVDKRRQRLTRINRSENLDHTIL